MITQTEWLESLTQNNTPDFAECLHYLSSAFPLLTQLESTIQDPEWHAEGNVARHTEAVLNELYQLLKNDAVHITGRERQALILAALLHDIAKPLTTRTREIDGNIRITSPRHETEGRNLIAIPLMSLNLDYSVVTRIMGLVGYHNWPKLLVIKNAEYRKYLQLALNADIQLLYWLELADMLGRNCPDKQKQLAILAEYRMFAEEYQLWKYSDIEAFLCKDIQVKTTVYQQRYVNGYAVNELIRGDISLPSEAIARTYEHCQKYSRLYLLFGISGSGKSEWIKQHKQNNWHVISLDKIREELHGDRSNQKNRGQVLQIARTRLKAALAAKHDIVWDATNLRNDYRNQLTTLGRNYGALIILVIFHLDEATLQRQNLARPYSVPTHVLQRQIETIQWPTAEEAHQQLVIGKNGEILLYSNNFDYDGAVP